MTGLFLIVWFYLYTGLMFGMVANAMVLFPNVGSFWKVIGWPVFFADYLFKRNTGKC